jgi:hypothetical protein
MQREFKCSSTDSLAESTMSEKIKCIARRNRKCSRNGHRHCQISALSCASNFDGTSGFCFCDRQTESPIDSNDCDSNRLYVDKLRRLGFRVGSLIALSYGLPQRQRSETFVEHTRAIRNFVSLFLRDQKLLLTLPYLENSWWWYIRQRNI